MKPRKKKTPMRDLNSIFESDDEYPDSYCEETVEYPAYLNDLRFDDIVLPWLENCKPIKATKLKNEPQTSTKLIPDKAVKAEKATQEIEKNRSKILISQGILSTDDLFLVKSIAEYCSESTILWFIDSLKQKFVLDRFHKSCLASDISYEIK